MIAQFTAYAVAAAGVLDKRMALLPGVGQLSYLVAGHATGLVGATRYLLRTGGAGDIPACREIGGDAISYFDMTDSGMLRQRTRECLAAPRITPSMPFLIWRESTEGLFTIIKKGAY
jgi:hypothetical protein